MGGIALGPRESLDGMHGAEERRKGSLDFNDMCKTPEG